ncbi:MAG: PDZ domain-containing protein [Luteolibacter sp.]
MAVLRLLLLLTLATAKGATPQAIVAKPQDVRTQPLVTLQLNGKSTPFLIDTGSAAPLIVFPAALSKPTAETTAVDLRVAAKQPPLADQATVLAAEIPGAKGILGWPLLKNSIWKLDLPTGRHEFLATLPDVRGWTSFPILANRSSLAIRHPQLGEVFLDSGARRGVCLTKDRWSAWRKDHPTAPLTLSEGLSPASPGGAFANPVAHDASFAFAPLEFRHTNVGEAFFDPAHDGASILLGLETFLRTTVIVDGPGKRVYFQPSDRSPAYKPLPPNRLQAAFVLDPDFTNALCVRLLPGGAGQRAGLQDGDRVLELNGSGSPPSFATMFDLVRTQGAKATLRIRRNRQPLVISFEVP